MGVIFQLIPFLSIFFWPHGERESFTLQRYHNLLSPHSWTLFKKGLGIFLFMSQGTTFQVVNHLYSPKIFGIYGKHLNSVGKKRLSQVQGKFSLSLWVLIYGRTMITRLYVKPSGACIFLLFSQVLFSMSNESHTECHGTNSMFSYPTHMIQSSSPNIWTPWGEGLGTPCGIPFPRDENV